MLPKLRKSLQKSDKRISPPVLSQKAPYAIEAPKAVIRALYDYTQGSSQELSFRKGDFFHVVGNENDTSWYVLAESTFLECRHALTLTQVRCLQPRDRRQGSGACAVLPGIRQEPEGVGRHAKSGVYRYRI